MTRTLRSILLLLIIEHGVVSQVQTNSSTNITDLLFSEAPREYTDQAILRCNAESVGRFKGNITYEWYKNGTHVSLAPELLGKIKMTQNGALVINRVNNFMHGEYICNINSNNMTIGLTRIIFDRLQHVEAGKRCNAENCVTVEDCYAPSASENMGLCATINEVCCDLENTAPIGIPAKGKTVLLECGNKTDPNINYIWMRSGLKLSDHPAIKDKFTITKSGHLLLNSITDNDYGEYNCFIDGQLAGTAILNDSRILNPETVDKSKCVPAKDCREPTVGGACPEEGQVECNNLTGIELTHCRHFNGNCKKSCEPAYSRNARDCPKELTCCTNDTLPIDNFVSTASSINVTT